MAEVFVQLKDTSGSFTDLETGWNIRREEIKAYPANAGARTAQWKQLGHLVEVKPPAKTTGTDK